MAKIGYSCVKPIINTNNNILGILETLKLPSGIKLIPWNKMHVTLMYDERNQDRTVEIPPTIYEASVIGVAVLGKAVVFTLASDELLKRHFALLEQGFKYSFSNYAPHMSIVYADSKSDDNDKELHAICAQVQRLFKAKKLPATLYLTDETWTKCD